MTDQKSASFRLDWPAGRPFQVIGFGANAVDWVCDIPVYPAPASRLRIEKLHRLGGGQIATAAALCARFGLRVRYVSRVGDDEVGRFSLQSLSREPMDLQVETIAGAYSQYAVILVDRETGERTILWDSDRKLNYLPGELPRQQLMEGQILHLDATDLEASIQAARWAVEEGIKVSIDVDNVEPGIEELLELSDFVIPPQDFACQFAKTDDWRKALRRLSESTAAFVAITRGRRGCAALWEGELFEVPGFSVTPVDTTGAGDVFHGAFVYALFQDWSIYRCLRFANACGALASTRLGARDGIPSLEEALRLVDPDSRIEAV